MVAGLLETVRLDLESAAAFISSLTSEERRHEQRQRQANAFVARMQALQGAAITLAQSTVLVNAVSDGPWADAQTEALEAAIAALPAAAVEHSNLRPTSRRGFQSCYSFCNFLTKAEWDGLKGPGILRCAKISQLASRAWSLGITTPSERTSFRIAEILCYCHGIETKDEQEKAYNEVKAAIREMDSRRKYPHRHLQEYPSAPSQLPADMYEFAYSSGEQPIASPENIVGVMCGSKRRRRDKSSEDGVRMALQMLGKELGMSVQSPRGVNTVQPCEQRGGMQSPDVSTSSLETKSKPGAPPSSPVLPSGRSSTSSPLRGSAVAFKPLLALPSANAGATVAGASEDTKETAPIVAEGVARAAVEMLEDGLARRRGNVAARPASATCRVMPKPAAAGVTPSVLPGAQCAIPMMDIGSATNQPHPFHYNGGKISVSWRDPSFRVFFSKGTNVYQKSRWNSHGSVEDAWAEAVRRLRAECGPH